MAVEQQDKVFYIPKNIFKYPKLTIAEIRLVIYLYSNKNKTVSNMSTKEKNELFKSRARASKAKEYEKHLIDLKLLKPNGTGLTISSDNKCNKGNCNGFITINSMNEIDVCKSFRQLFIWCLMRWDKRNNLYYFKYEDIYNIMGDSKLHLIKNKIRYIEKSLGVLVGIKDDGNKICMGVLKIDGNITKEEQGKLEDEFENYISIQENNQLAYEWGGYENAGYLN